jgi:hypothetical protein
MREKHQFLDNRVKQTRVVQNFYRSVAPFLSAVVYDGTSDKTGFK